MKVALSSSQRSRFRQNKVDGALLLVLTESDIRNDVKISDNLAVKRILLHLEELKVGKKLPPSIAGQTMLKSVASVNNTNYHERLDVSDTTPRSLQLYRIWESMDGAPSTVLTINPAQDTMDSVNAAALAALRKGPGAAAIPADASARVVTREGTTVADVRRAPAKAFLLVIRSGDNDHRSEYYMYPSDHVGERFLVPLPSVQRSVEVEALSDTPRLMLVRNFLTEEDCEVIRKLAIPLMKPSTVLKQGDQTKGEQQVVDNVRTSSTAWLMNRNDPTIAKIRMQVQELIKVPMEYAEDMQVLEYTFKQHYHVHHDYFDPSLYPGDKRWGAGHNRMITVFFYLTSVEEGGQTVFPYAGVPKETFEGIHAYGSCEEANPKSIKVPAVKGHAIIFYSMTARGHVTGELDKTSLHGGCDPIRGTKWAANYWIRNGPVL